MAKRKYGLNVFSLFPRSLGTYGPERSIELATTAGFDGIQALPLRGWSYQNIRTWEKHVISYENAFNYGPLWQALLRTIGVLDEPTPTLLDWALFGRHYISLMPNAIQVVRDISFRVAVTEINPELWSMGSRYVRHCNEGGELCWDTWHSRRKSRDGVAIDDWELLLNTLPDDSVKLIHVHPTKKETRAFINGEESELTKMLKMLGAKFPNAPAIVEVFPPVRSRTASLSFLMDLHIASRAWLDE